MVDQYEFDKFCSERKSGLRLDQAISAQSIYREAKRERYSMLADAITANEAPSVNYCKTWRKIAAYWRDSELLTIADKVWF